MSAYFNLTARLRERDRNRLRERLARQRKVAAANPQPSTPAKRER